MKPACECKCCDPRVMAVALGRWILGMMFLFFGIGKLADVNGFAASLVKQFEKTWLPKFLLSGFGHALPFLETILGALLLLGLFRNATLFATGLLLIVLTFGMVLQGQAGVVFNNTSYLFMTAVVLFAAEYDLWVLYPRRRKETPVRDEVAQRTGNPGVL